MSSFEMQVKDTFFLQDGTIAFVGPVETDTAFINACRSDHIHDGEVKTSFAIDGEMVPSGGNSDSPSGSSNFQKRSN
jgi:hypothetical protein